MISRNEFEFIKEKVFEILDFKYDGVFELVESEGVYVKICEEKCIIGAKEKILCARSLMLMAKNNGAVGLEISQKAKFTMQGIMPDLSRNGVMRVSAIKKYLDYMACFGINTLFMYMEDVYEVKEYPRFGYMRGRYTAEELKELDDYAYSLGIEIIPCIQTLAHLATYLKWNEVIRNSAGTLLCDDEKTYEFIEALIKTMKNCFRTNRIHVGMDEAHDFCDGKYKEIHGECDKFDVFVRHLTKVTELCGKYGLKPIIWDDMPFKIGSKTGDYYDIDSVIPEEVKNKLPDVDLVYWDYDRDDVERYEKLIEAHKALGKKVIYAGTFWTHYLGHFPVVKYVSETLEKGLKACRNTGIGEVMVTLWGDDGTECNYLMTLPLLSILGEYTYSEDVKKENIEKLAEFVTKIDFEAMYAMSEYHVPFGKENETAVWYEGMGKRLFYTDLLYNLTGRIEFFKTVVGNYENGYKTMKRLAEKGGPWEKIYSYAANIFCVLKDRADILINIRNEYAQKNMEYFKKLADEILPDMTQLYKDIYKASEKIWMYTNKPFGWEVISARYGRMIIRMEYYTDIVRKFAYGYTDKIEELEFDFIEYEDKSYAPIADSRNITITT